MPSSFSSTSLSVSNPPRIPPINLSELRSARQSLTRRPLRPKHPSRREQQTRPRRFTLVVSPDNGSEGIPILPKKNSRLYTELENKGMIRSIEFNERNVEHCRGKIRAAFMNIRLEFCHFYRGDGHTGVLTHAQLYNIDNIDMDALERYISSVVCPLIFSLASGQGGQSGPKKIYIGPIAPQSFILDESDNEADLSEPQDSVQFASNYHQNSSAQAGLLLPVRSSYNFEPLSMDDIPEATLSQSTSSFPSVNLLNTNEDDELPDVQDIPHFVSAQRHTRNVAVQRLPIQGMLSVISFNSSSFFDF